MVKMIFWQYSDYLSRYLSTKSVHRDYSRLYVQAFLENISWLQVSIVEKYRKSGEIRTQKFVKTSREMFIYFVIVQRRMRSARNAGMGHPVSLVD